MIIQNAKKIIENAEGSQKVTYLQSTYVHDYVTYQLSNGHRVVLDGGNYSGKGGYYLRSSRDTVDILPKGTFVYDYCLDSDSKLSEVLGKLLWGTSGPDGKGPFRWVPISECSLEHLEAITKHEATMAGISPLHLFVIEYWIKEKL